MMKTRFLFGIICWLTALSANVTRAGLRQDTSSQLNIEAGILTEDPELVSSIRSFFSEIWNSKWCSECHIDDNDDE